MWSPVEKTALAEAEVEYHEKSSPQIYVKFPLVKGPATLQGAKFVIWTTTPWTIPGNRAIAYSESLAYGLYEVTEASEGSFAAAGERLLLGDPLAQATAQYAKIPVKRIADVAPAGVVAAHPPRGPGSR